MFNYMAKYKNWKKWGVVGFVVAGVSYICVNRWAKLAVLDELETYAKVLIGFGQSLLVGTIASAASTAQYYCRRCLKRRAVMKALEEKLSLSINNANFSRM